VACQYHRCSNHQCGKGYILKNDKYCGRCEIPKCIVEDCKEQRIIYYDDPFNRERCVYHQLMYCLFLGCSEKVLESENICINHKCQCGSCVYKEDKCAACLNLCNVKTYSTFCGQPIISDGVCQVHLCQIKGCNKRCGVDKCCDLHRCHLTTINHTAYDVLTERCRNTVKEEGLIYCTTHNCISEGCRKEVFIFTRVCLAHKCSYYGCSNMREQSTSLCERHKDVCLHYGYKGCEEKREDSSDFCIRHKCKVCNNDKSCEIHKCLKCKANKDSFFRFCDKCKCPFKDCNNQSANGKEC
jgi:hypothetical protein